MTTVYSGSALGSSPGAPTGHERDGGRGCGPAVAGYLLAAGLWVYLLHGFVTTGVLIALAVFGPALAMGGLYLAGGACRHALTSVWYFGAFGSVWPRVRASPPAHPL